LVAGILNCAEDCILVSAFIEEPGSKETQEVLNIYFGYHVIYFGFMIWFRIFTCLVPSSRRVGKEQNLWRMLHDMLNEM